MTSNLPPELKHAAELPPKVTDKYVFFFGYEGFAETPAHSSRRTAISEILTPITALETKSASNNVR